MHVEPLKELAWAYQLHYHLCFRTHRRHQFFIESERVGALRTALWTLCTDQEVHALEFSLQPGHSELLVSLRPAHVISKVMKTLKGRSSAELCQKYGLIPPVWARGYLARSVGRVRSQAVKQYLARQAEHHRYGGRALAPVFRYRATSPVPLSLAHSYFELNHHVVLATRYRRSVFGSRLGEALVDYWIKVAARRGFAIDQATVLPDH